jgi:hypothetical protein
MTRPVAPTPCGRSVENLHAGFLWILPRIELHGRIYFRHLRPDRRDDALQEMAALAWKWFLRLRESGRDPADFLTGFVSLLARAVNSGRRLAGMAKSKDVLNPATQRRHGFHVERLPSCTQASHERLFSEVNGQRQLDAYEERLRDNTITPVPEQVVFRIDWPAFLRTLTGRERRLIRAMALSERTLDLSKQFEVSPARISQLRREFHDGWERFCGEREEGRQAR